MSLPNRTDPRCCRRGRCNVIRLSSTSFKRAGDLAPVRIYANLYTVTGNNGLVGPCIISRVGSRSNGAISGARPAAVHRIVDRSASGGIYRVVRSIISGNANGGTCITKCGINNGANASAGLNRSGRNRGGGCVMSFTTVTPTSSPRVTVVVVYSRPGISLNNNTVYTPITTAIVGRDVTILNIRPSCARRRGGALSIGTPGIVTGSISSTRTTVGDTKLSYGIINANSGVADRSPTTNGAIPSNKRIILCASNTRGRAMAIPSFAKLAISRTGDLTTDDKLGVRVSNGTSSSTLIITCGRDRSRNGRISTNAIVAMDFGSAGTILSWRLWAC